MRIAVLLTVYNRKKVTLNGLTSLYRAMNVVGERYEFDVYMTDDGSTDGTSFAVSSEFPDVNIVKGDGNLYWGGGMRRSWQSSIESGIRYDYFLWYNDDAVLFDDALKILFEPIDSIKKTFIVTGAFKDDNGNTSYGGFDKQCEIIHPNQAFPKVVNMNGNLVLVPYEVYDRIGMIDKLFIHGLGDFDYGLRAKENGFDVRLTSDYVGITNRHDNEYRKYMDRSCSIMTRFHSLYSPKYTPVNDFIFYYRHGNFMKACKFFFVKNTYAIAPIFANGVNAVKKIFK
jgi:GT2 family glycosyltransferase